MIEESGPGMKVLLMDKETVNFFLISLNSGYHERLISDAKSTYSVFLFSLYFMKANIPQRESCQCYFWTEFDKI